MVDRNRRNSIWYFVLLVLCGIGGMVAIGYWQTYDIKCFGFGGGKQWSWSTFPPQFVCSAY